MHGTAAKVKAHPSLLNASLDVFAFPVLVIINHLET